MMNAIPEATDELLLHLAEEAAEIIHAILKFRRFGPDGRDPRFEGVPSDRDAIAFEFGQFLAVQECLDALDEELISDDWVQRGRRSKLDKLRRYLRHSTLTVSETEGVSLCPKF